MYHSFMMYTSKSSKNLLMNSDRERAYNAHGFVPCIFASHTRLGTSDSWSILCVAMKMRLAATTRERDPEEQDVDVAAALRVPRAPEEGQQQRGLGPLMADLGSKRSRPVDQLHES